MFEELIYMFRLEVCGGADEFLWEDGGKYTIPFSRWQVPVFSFLYTKFKFLAMPISCCKSPYLVSGTVLVRDLVA
jgi:hypothetical protein